MVSLLKVRGSAGRDGGAETWRRGAARTHGSGGLRRWRRLAGGTGARVFTVACGRRASSGRVLPRAPTYRAVARRSTMWPSPTAIDWMQAGHTSGSARSAAHPWRPQPGPPFRSLPPSRFAASHSVPQHEPPSLCATGPGRPRAPPRHGIGVLQVRRDRPRPQGTTGYSYRTLL
jgi:hypothetical protein